MTKLNTPIGLTPVDTDRRRFLAISTIAVGGIGAAFTAVPFLESWTPSIKAQALGAPVDVDVSRIQEGQQITVPWRGRPVFIINRSEAVLKELSNNVLVEELRDPNSNESEQPIYAKNIYRAFETHKNFLIAIGICTHLGCVPIYRPEAGSVDATWIGGYFCPCHGSKYDLSGRVYKGVPAPYNLSIPPYHYVDEKIVRIGEGPT